MLTIKLLDIFLENTHHVDWRVPITVTYREKKGDDLSNIYVDCVTHIHLIIKENNKNKVPWEIIFVFKTRTLSAVNVLLLLKLVNRKN